MSETRHNQLPPSTVATPETAAQPRRPRRDRILTPASLLWIASLTLIAFIVIPLVAIFGRALGSGNFISALQNPVVTDALLLSFITTAITLLIAICIGTPIAYVLARYQFRGKDIIDTLIDLPIVLPPAVAGVALLMAFGRRGLLGPTLSSIFGVELPFTLAAVIIAQTFVATPFYVKAARSGFEAVDQELERVAATLGLKPGNIFRAVTLPLSLPILVGGAVMTWARALGEFGATIMFAGNFAGRTQTMPLAIYQTLESGDLDAALAISAILIVVSFSILIIFRVLTQRSTRLLRARDD